MVLNCIIATKSGDGNRLGAVDFKKSGCLFAPLVVALILAMFFFPQIAMVVCLSGQMIEDGIRPTDAQIIENFKEHKSDYLSLIEMVQRDQVEVGKFRIGKYFRSRPFLNIGESKWSGGADESSILKEYNLTVDRYKQYLSLLEKCGARQIKPEQNGAVKIYIQHFETLDYASYTALLYSPGGSPSGLELKQKTDKENKAYVIVEKNWYLTVSSSP